MKTKKLLTAICYFAIAGLFFWLGGYKLFPIGIETSSPVLEVILYISGFAVFISAIILTVLGLYKIGLGYKTGIFLGILGMLTTIAMNRVPAAIDWDMNFPVYIGGLTSFVTGAFLIVAKKIFTTDSTELLGKQKSSLAYCVYGSG